MGTAATPDIFDQLAGNKTAPGTVTGNTATVSSSAPRVATAPAKPAGDVFDQLAAGTSDTPTGPTLAPYDPASFGRFTTPENYQQWATTPPKSGPDSKPGEYEAWTGAHTPGGAMQTLKEAATPLPYAGLAAATALGPGEIYPAAHALVPALTRGVVAIGAWADAHPQAAKAVWEGLKAAGYYAGLSHIAKSAGNVIKAGD